MKIAWATDIHFDHCNQQAINSFIDELKYQAADLLFLTGDLTSHGGANALIHHLTASLNLPIYFVLGNHDFYGTSIETVRKNVDCRLNYLTKKKVVTLAPRIALIGHDGWCDGLAGDYAHSHIDSLISDFAEIDELKGLSKENRLHRMEDLSGQSVQHLKKLLLKALADHDTVFLLTHYPPYEEACLYEGQHSGKEWLPFFVNLSLGKMLSAMMLNHEDKQLSIYCGHSHHAAFYSPIPNISVEVGHAEYGKPRAQKPIFIDTLN